jgi:hypothetical protein
MNLPTIEELRGEHGPSLIIQLWKYLSHVVPTKHTERALKTLPDHKLREELEILKTREWLVRKEIESRGMIP